MSFRITLYLNQFFHDHRSVCRIFVSNKMQTIKDLQDHISKIFNIKNFVLMAQNQYLPSVESVMVLNQDDIITAVPLQTSSVICTSTPFSNDNRTTLDMTCHSSRIQESSTDSEEERPQKRKKSSETFKKPQDLMESVPDATPLVGSFQKKDEDTNVTSRKEKHLKKYNLLNQDLEEPCSSKQGTEAEQTSVADVKKSKSKLNKSVREKVMYFESKDARVEPNSSEKSKENSSESSRELDISDTMRKHKLFVRANTPYSKMSMELPKQHNIVKSIIIKNSTHNSSGFKSIDTSLQSKNDALSSNSKQSRDTTFEENKIVDNTKSFNSEKSTENNIVSNNSVFSVQTSLKYEKPIKFDEETIENSLEKSLKIEESNNNDCKKSPVKPIILQNIILQQSDLQVAKEKLKNISNDIEMQEIEIPLSNLSMDAAPVNSTVATNSSTSLDFGQHVTKRKRVRKRKSRKPKEVPMETVPVKPPNYDFKLRLPKPAPVLHIRFDENEKDDDVAAPQENTSLCENIENNIPVDGENDRMEIQREIIEDEVENGDNGFVQNENVLETQEKVELVESSIGEEDFLDYVSKTVENCPLILNLPEVGNTIAFKILKMAGTYTPEVSNYIVGKVLNISENQSTIMINILSGLEETRGPIGKFSLETEEEDITAYQEYEWNAMMEKRLVSK